MKLAAHIEEAVKLDDELAIVVIQTVYEFEGVRAAILTHVS